MTRGLRYRTRSGRVSEVPLGDAEGSSPRGGAEAGAAGIVEQAHESSSRSGTRTSFASACSPGEHKVEGKEITPRRPRAERAQVIDLMDALKQSLAKRASSPAAPESERKPPIKLVKRVAEAAAKPEGKAQAGKK